jgi:hypothetical protein
MSAQKVPKDYSRPCPRALHDPVSGQHPQPFGTKPEVTADKLSVIDSDSDSVGILGCHRCNQGERVIMNSHNSLSTLTDNF